MVNLICKLFGHNWKTYHRKKSRTGTELNKFKKCKRCGKKGDAGHTTLEYQLYNPGPIAHMYDITMIDKKGGDK